MPRCRLRAARPAPRARSPPATARYPVLIYRAGSTAAGIPHKGFPCYFTDTDKAVAMCKLVDIYLIESFFAIAGGAKRSSMRTLAGSGPEPASGTAGTCSGNAAPCSWPVPGRETTSTCPAPASRARSCRLARRTRRRPIASAFRRPPRKSRPFRRSRPRRRIRLPRKIRPPRNNQRAGLRHPRIASADRNCSGCAKATGGRG